MEESKPFDKGKAQELVDLGATHDGRCKMVEQLNKLSLDDLQKALHQMIQITHDDSNSPIVISGWDVGHDDLVKREERYELQFRTNEPPDVAKFGTQGEALYRRYKSGQMGIDEYREFARLPGTLVATAVGFTPSHDHYIVGPCDKQNGLNLSSVLELNKRPA